MPLQPGTTLGPYKVTAKIGEGGMGEVYRARDTKLDRDVALKVLPHAFTDDPDRLARFEREAKVLASLNHPNIGHIYGLEEAEGQKALVLELVEGPTLAERIKQGPIPVDEALPIATQIAEALEAAHEQGIIHRDLKPANIKVKDDGTVKVLDFGLAKAFQPDASDVSASMSPTISLTAAATQMGMVIGTAAYMAPEQAKGKVVDKRADVWAFGAVLFEMLTGSKPFSGDDVSTTLARVIEREPDWEALPSDLSPVLATYVRRCLAKEPKQRIRDIGDVQLAMEGAFETTFGATAEPVAMPTLQVWRRPIPLVLAGLTLTLIGGLTGWSLSRPGPEAVNRFEIPLRLDESFTGGGRHMVAVSPDGRHIAYSTSSGLSIRSLGQLTPALLVGNGDAREPFFSPDGQWVGFQANGQLQKVSITGGAPVTLCDAGRPRGASWGADDMILYGGPEGVMRVPSTSGTPDVLIAVEDGELAHGPQMLPGGEWVLFTLRPSGTVSWDEAQIAVQSVVTNERTVLIEGGRDARYVPTGHLVYGLRGVLFAVPFDLSALQVTGGPVPLVEGVREAGPGAMQFSVASNGSLVYVPGVGEPVRALVWVGRDGQEEAISAEPRSYVDPRVSPDGTRVALGVLGENPDVWIWHHERETLTRLTFDGGADLNPLWTLDGSRVVFFSRREGGGLFWKAADGTGEVERLLESPNEPRPYAWSPDGLLIFRQPPGDIGVLTVEDDGAVDMLLETEFDEDTPALSSDGRWLAYTSDESGQDEIYVQPFPNLDEGKWLVSTDGGTDPVWSPDGQELFFWLPGTGLMMSQVETNPTFTPGNPERVFDTTGYRLDGGGRRYDISPDGERFVMVLSGSTQTTGDDSFNGLIFVQNWFQELTERVPVN